MANGVWHTGYEIAVRLTHADLGHPDRPDLLEEITRPVESGTGSYWSAWSTTRKGCARPKTRAARHG
jgi:hypothetical protein